MKKVLAALGTAAVLMTSAACGSQSGYVDEMQYGYYDSANHYHAYDHPHTVHITRKYYTTHQYQYMPHGNQRTVIVRRSVRRCTNKRCMGIFGRR